MKLRDLDARFVGVPYRNASGNLCISRVEKFSDAAGVVFSCPACQWHYIMIWFSDRGVPPEAEPTPRWTATGTGLDDLTLTPSINLDVPEARKAGSCLWHGHVRAGDAA